MKIGIECGGTFTDVVVLGDDGTLAATNKVFSTPRDPSIAVNEALMQLAPELKCHAELLHGSTVATNALIERRGAKVGLVTTQGFRDLVFLQRQDRASMYDLKITKPEAVVTREDIVEVVERISSDGSVILELEADSVKRAAERLLHNGVDAVAVCLLHSYANTTHEDRVAEALAEIIPGIEIAVSSRSSREFREYERTSTTTIDAFLRPMVSNYLRKLGDKATSHGISDLRVMQSNGGMVPAATAASNPLTMLRSGPAAGVAGAIAAATAAGYDRIVTMDMGGTSTDVTMVIDGKPELTTETVADGLPVKVPMIDIVAVGAGGGSLVGIDSGGMLTVGPQSAGASPGPVCYGRGGTEPTVTDANVVRGVIRPETFLGGQAELDVDAAARSLEPFGRQFGKTAEQVAEDVIKLATVHMAGAIRMATTERGHDARTFALFTYGGAGPMHAASVAEELGIDTVVVPPHNGLASAYGLLTAGFRREFSQTVLRELNELGAEELQILAHRLRDDALDRLSAEGIKAHGAQIEFAADMRYRGQGFELLVDVGDDLRPDALQRLFETAQQRRFGYLDSEKPVQLVTLRLTVSFDNDRAILPRVEHVEAQVSTIRPMVEGGKHVSSRFCARSSLTTGERIEGPAVVEDATSTTVIPTGWIAGVDEHTNLVLKKVG